MPKKKGEQSENWDRISHEQCLREEDTWPFQAGYPEKTNTDGHVFFQLSGDGVHIEMIDAVGDSMPLTFSILHVDQEGRLWRTAAFVTDVQDANNCPAWVETTTGRMIPYNNIAAWAGSAPR